MQAKRPAHRQHYQAFQTEHAPSLQSIDRGSDRFVFAPDEEAVDTIDTPEDMLDCKTPVAGTHPDNSQTDIYQQPEKPLFAIPQNHENLRQNSRNGGESIEIGLGIVGISPEEPACQETERYDHYQNHHPCPSRKAARLQFGRVVSSNGIVLPPHENTIDHRQEIESILRHFGIEVFLQSKNGIGGNLQKTKEKG